MSALRAWRTPTIMQQEAVECGAACLAMVLAYYGRWVSLEELRGLCGVGRDGTNASNIVKAARTHGLTAKGLRKEVEELANLPLPQVVFWNFNHFVVVERIDRDRNRIWLNDPATGPRSVTVEEFSEAFTGVVLAFEPGIAFVRKGARASLWRLLRDRVEGTQSAIAYAVLAGLLLVVPGVLAASFGRVFIDYILVEGRQRWLEPLLAAMIAVAVLKGLLTFLQQWSLARTQTAIGTVLQVRQMWAVLHLPLSFFSQRLAGDLANRFTMLDRLAGLVSNGLAPAGIALVSIVGYGAALYLLDPLLGLVMSVFAMGALLFLWIAARGMEDASRRQVAYDSRLQGATLQGVTLIDEFRASGTESRFVARWSGFQAKVIDAEQSSMLRSNMLSMFSSLMLALGGVAILIVGGFQVMDGVITIGILLAFQMLVGNFTASMLSLVGVGGQLQQVRGIAERLDDILHYGTDPMLAAPAVAAAPVPRGALDLTLRDVSFGYGPLDAPFIDGLNLTVPAGTRVALVGASGSGKSTLGRLVVGLLPPRAGTIEFGGAPIHEWKQSELRRAVAYVDQNVALFEGTFQDNLSLWDRTMPEERLVAAARDAEAHAFITSRPGGYVGRLAEAGGNLSGGERQRIVIARALAVNPSLLVLDEATSALDPPVEAAIMDAIRRRGCGAIIIAHRLSTIRDCDVIVVLSAGRIVEMGTHAELIANGQVYRHLVEH